MSSSPLGRYGVVPDGTAGEPMMVFWSGTLGGASFSHSIVNSNTWDYVLTDIYAVEGTANAGDYITLGWQSPYGLFWGTNVGTGHTGAFFDHVSGKNIFYHGWTLTINGTTSGGTGWTVFGYGFAVPTLDTYWLS